MELITGVPPNAGHGSGFRGERFPSMVGTSNPTTDTARNASEAEPARAEGFFRLTPSLWARLAALEDSSAVVVYLAIAQHADNARGHWDLSVEQIGLEAGVGATTVRRAVAVLETANFVATEQTFRVAGSYLTLAEIRARIGGTLATAATRNGGSRWELRAPGEDPIAVSQGYNRYHLLPLTDGAAALAKSSSESGPPWSGTRARVARIPGAESDQTNQTNKNQTKREDHAPASRAPKAEVNAANRSVPGTSEKDARGDADRIVDAFLLAKGIDPARVKGRPRETARHVFARDLSDCTTGADVAACVAYMLTDPWYTDRMKLTPAAVVNAMPSWDGQGRPAAITPKLNAAEHRQAAQDDNNREYQESVKKLGRGLDAAPDDSRPSPRLEDLMRDWGSSAIADAIDVEGRERAVIGEEIIEVESRSVAVEAASSESAPPRQPSVIPIPATAPMDLAQLQAKAKRDRERFRR